MQKKFLLQVIVVLLFLLFYAGTALTHSNMLHKRDQNIIRIAYMNGSVDALKLDIERIKELKNNDRLFKALVYSAADNYISKVENLSQKKVTITNQRGATYTVTSKGKKINPRNWTW